MCNGRALSHRDGRCTIFNYFVVRINEFTMVREDYLHAEDHFHVEDFNEWADHAPIHF